MNENVLFNLKESLWRKVIKWSKKNFSWQGLSKKKHLLQSSENPASFFHIVSVDPFQNKFVSSSLKSQPYVIASSFVFFLFQQNPLSYEFKFSFLWFRQRTMQMWKEMKNCFSKENSFKILLSQESQIPRKLHNDYDR